MRNRGTLTVTTGVTLTSTPEYPSSASSRWKNSFNSAKKTPSENHNSWSVVAPTASMKRESGRLTCYKLATLRTGGIVSLFS